MQAVILSNHFRSFYFIKEYLQEIFPNTDFYISTWDHDRSYFSIEELKKLNIAPELVELLKRMHLDKSFVKNNIEELTTNYSITTDGDFYSWVESISEIDSLEFLKYKFGQIFSSLKAYELFANSNKNYDIVYKMRMDSFIYRGSKELELNKNTLYTTVNRNPRIMNGHIWLNDLCFYGTQESINSYFNNLKERINKLLTSGIYTEHHAKNVFNLGRVYGNLLLGTGLTLKQGIYEALPIRKDCEDINLYDKKQVIEVEQAYTSAKTANYYLFPPSYTV